MIIICTSSMSPGFVRVLRAEEETLLDMDLRWNAFVELCKRGELHPKEIEISVTKLDMARKWLTSRRQ